MLHYFSKEVKQGIRESIHEHGETRTHNEKPGDNTLPQYPKFDENWF